MTRSILSCAFVGLIPPSVVECEGLGALILSQNLLTGGLPAGMDALNKIWHVSLVRGNSLTGGKLLDMCVAIFNLEQREL